MHNSYPIQNTLICVAPLCCMLLLVTLFIGTGDEVVQFFSSYRAAHPSLTNAVQWITDWGNPLLYIVYATLLTIAVRRQNKRLRAFVLAYIVGQLLVSFLLVRILKVSIGRPRPLADGIFQAWSFSSSHNSLPSGHTAEIVGATIPLAFFRGKMFSFFAGTYAGVVGMSRVYLSMHHTSDVFFGMLTGCFAAYIIHTLWNRKCDD